MITKIDISSLDEVTKNKIKEMRKRCAELHKGVHKSVLIKVRCLINWTDGTECDVVDVGVDIPGIPLKPHWGDMEKLTNDFKKEIDEEIKNIINFSNSVADKLGVDKEEFFKEYFVN
jgi:hypothetical protein